MKKRRKLIILIFCSLLIGSIFLLENGISLLNIKGFVEIGQKKQLIDTRVSHLSDFITINYTNALAELKQATTDLNRAKKAYEDQVEASDSYISEQEKHDINYLWTKLGNYARDENVVIKIDLVLSEIDSNLYCLNFSVTGDYTNTTNFINDIENDSDLGFKIENFKMIETRKLWNVTYNVYM